MVLPRDGEVGLHLRRVLWTRPGSSATRKILASREFRLKGENVKTLATIFAVVVSLFAVAVTASPRQERLSDSDYIAQALSAAPEAVAKGAAVVRAEKGGSMRTLREGNNGVTS